MEQPKNKKKKKKDWKLTDENGTSSKFWTKQSEISVFKEACLFKVSKSFHQFIA